MGKLRQRSKSLKIAELVSGENPGNLAPKIVFLTTMKANYLKAFTRLCVDGSITVQKGRVSIIFIIAIAVSDEAHQSG